MVDAPCESKIKTVVEGHVSTENVHSAGLRWSSYISSISKPISTNREKMLEKRRRINHSGNPSHRWMDCVILWSIHQFYKNFFHPSRHVYHVMESWDSWEKIKSLNFNWFSLEKEKNQIYYKLLSNTWTEIYIRLISFFIINYFICLLKCYISVFTFSKYFVEYLF